MPIERTMSGKVHQHDGGGERRGRHSSPMAEETPHIEEQDTPRRVGDGKGLNHHTFDDAAHYAAIMHPHAPHENPAGHYGVIDGAGVDNTRPSARAQIEGRRPSMGRHEQTPPRHGKRDQPSGRNKSKINIPEKGKSRHSGRGHKDY